MKITINTNTRRTTFSWRQHSHQVDTRDRFSQKIFHKTLQRHEPGQHFLIFLVHLRADRPSCYSWFSRALFSQSNPVDRPPAHQLHLHWRAIRQRHWHSRASVCAEAHVYSTTQEPGFMHYTGITLFIVFSAASGRECLFGEAKEFSEKFSWELGLSFSWSKCRHGLRTWASREL